MNKKDWTKVLTATAISVFVGVVVLAVVLYTVRKNKLSKRKLTQLVKEDVDFWKGVKETDRKGAEKLREWWKIIGADYSVDSLMDSQFQSEHFWSAIYISNLIKRWGAGNKFKYSARHSDYICEGLKAKEDKDNSKVFWSYNPSEKTVEVGDIVGIGRANWVTLDNICSGAPTHTDVVFEIEKTSSGYKAYTIGGNLGNSVGQAYVTLDKDKKISEPDKYLVIMKNKMV
jgi:hypothetical protein